MNDLRSDIERYQKGEMSPQEMHALERKALDDPFLADALEGSSLLSTEDFAKDVQEMQGKILRQPKTYWFYTVRVAAAVTVLAVATFLLWPYMMNPGSESKDLALEQKMSKEKDSGGEQIVEETQPEPEAENSLSLDNKKVDGEPDLDIEATEAEQIQTEKKDGAGPPVEKPREQVEIAKADTKPAISSFRLDSVAVETKNAIANTEITADDEVKGEDKVARSELAVQPEPAAQERKEALSSRSFGDQSNSKRKSAAPQPTIADTKDAISTRKLTGQVTSAEDGSPLPGVNVVLKGTTIGTVTDISGRYEIPVAQNEPTLEFSFIGMQSIERAVPPTQNEVDVTMSVDASQLSEVVVTGYSQSAEFQNESTTELAHPEIGYREFKKYLEQNIQYPQEAIEKKVQGRVTIEFTVESNGALSEFIVLRGIGSGCDDELIRLIKESKWVPTKQNSTPVKDKARVRLKFDLPKN